MTDFSAPLWRSVTYGDDLFVATANSGTNRVMTSDHVAPGFTLSTTTATVSETGTTATFTVVLDAHDTGEATGVRPKDNVIASAPGEVRPF